MAAQFESLGECEIRVLGAVYPADFIMGFADRVRASYERLRSIGKVSLTEKKWLNMGLKEEELFGNIRVVPDDKRLLKCTYLRLLCELLDQTTGFNTYYGIPEVLAYPSGSDLKPHVDPTGEIRLLTNLGTEPAEVLVAPEASGIEDEESIFVGDGSGMEIITINPGESYAISTVGDPRSRLAHAVPRVNGDIARIMLFQTAKVCAADAPDVLSPDCFMTPDHFYVGPRQGACAASVGEQPEARALTVTD